MTTQPATETTKPRTVPCPVEACNGGEINYEHGPSENCFECSGEGVIGWFVCPNCSRTYACSDEMPGYGADTKRPVCGDCLNREALDGQDFAAVAVALTEARELIESLWKEESEMVRGCIAGRAMGILGYHAEKLAKLGALLASEPAR